MAPPTRRASTIGPSARTSAEAARAPVSSPPTEPVGSTEPGTVVSAMPHAHHQLAELALDARRVLHDAGDLAAVEDRDPVAQREQLLELGRDHDGRDTVLGHGSDALPDHRGRADVEPVRRLVEDHDAR